MKTIALPLMVFILGASACSKKSGADTAETQPPSTTIPFTISPNLVDPDATGNVKSLYVYLVEQFGKRTISGQTDNDADFSHIYQVTGNTPLIRDYDMQPYSPQYSYNWANGGFAFGADNSSPNVPNAINWYNNSNKKAIIDFQWHWHSPSGGTVGTNTFYTQYTTFDVSRAIVPGTQENTDAIRDIDAIAVQLKKLSDAGVPVLWRPMHESGGTWFWWSAKGPAAYIALWNIMFDRLMHYHSLHNLIWVWNGDDLNWYPGNDKADILGIDSYPGNFVYTSEAAEFNKAYSISGGNKLIAMTENGPIPDLQAAFNTGITWSYFMSWYDVSVGNSDQHLKDIYQNTNVVSLEKR